MKITFSSLVICRLLAFVPSSAQSTGEMVSFVEQDLTSRYNGSLVSDIGFSAHLTSPETEARLLYENSVWPETITGKKEYASYEDALVRFKNENKRFIKERFSDNYHLYYVDKVFNYSTNNLSVVESYFVVNKKTDRVVQVAVVGYLCDSTSSDTNHHGKAKPREGAGSVRASEQNGTTNAVERTEVEKSPPVAEPPAAKP